MKTHAALFLALLTASAQAGPRTSANYSIITDTADAGGLRTTSAAYTNDGSAGAVTGLSTVASPLEVVRHGYAGQLYDIVGLSLDSASVGNNVNETATLQLAAWQLLDDTSFLAVNANSVAWSVVSGPITGISTSGLATVGAVPQNTAATAQGIFGGLTGTLNLTVIDSISDNFGFYAGDGIPDSWQVQYFGLGTGGQGNPQGLPNVDADGTGQTNLFKYTAGLNPTDGTRFTITIAPTPGQPGQMSVTYSPVVAGRTYAVTAKTSLSGSSWSAINASGPTTNGSQQTITDLSATGPAKFYHVEITKP
jgi:hypothetical protein